MQHPCGTGPQKPRTMAAVSPLHQVVPQPPTLNPYDAPNNLSHHHHAAFGSTASAASAQRTSSFAAALRKLAKQAGDPVVGGEKDISQLSPVTSPALNQRSLTPKRNGQSSQSMYLNNSSGIPQQPQQHPAVTSFPSSSPPVVTIASSRPHPAHTSDSRKLQVMDLGGLSQSNGPTNGHLSDPLCLKLDSSKSGPRSSTQEKWDDHVSKSLTTSSGSSQSRPHATIAPLPRPDDSLTSSRGFQPYRSADDIRSSLPHHLSPFDHHPSAAYQYTPTFLPPPHLPHPAYRFDDPLFLDRYSLLRSPVMPFPGQPGLMASPAAFYPQSRYDLLAQSLSLSSANSTLLHHERLKLEEERRQREKEVELDQSRKRELERERREREQQKEKEHKEKDKRDKDKSHKNDHGENNRMTNHSSSHSKRAEYSTPKNDVSSHALVNQISPPTVSNSSSAPLNLVMHQPPNTEHQKKETELWLPWQQQPNNHAKDNRDENINGLNMVYQHPTLVQQENHRVNTKDQMTSEKLHVPYNLPFYNNEKKLQHDIAVSESEQKKYFSHNAKKFDSIHHHITELSKKETLNNEWKHEKLQKACTNNHRKSVSEVKKLREESHHGSHHSQKKHVNGLVKSVNSLDEGMHARLLETEKSRIEFHSQFSHKTNHQIDKLSVPNNVQINGKEINHVEQQLMSVLKQTVDIVPVRSKLDKEAEDLKTKSLTDVENEEPPLSDFLILTKGPPLRLDTNAMKMKYFKYFGLTSCLKRKKIELDMYLKRKKVLHEEQNFMQNCIIEEKVTLSKQLSEMYPTIDVTSDKLHSEINAAKCEFFSSLCLRPLTVSQKEENTRFRKAILQERAARLQHSKMKSKRLMPPKLIQADKNKPGLSEIKNNEDSTNDSSRLAGQMPNKSTSTSKNTNQVPYTHGSDKVEFAVPTLPQHGIMDGSQLSAKEKSAIKRNSKMRTKYSFKRGHSLKYEYKPSVSPMQNNYFANVPAIKNEGKSHFQQTHISTATQVDLVTSPCNTLEIKENGKELFNWPGLDAIIESYHRHNKEQSCEKETLTEKYKQLKAEQENLKEEANLTSKAMSELLKLKLDLDEKKTKYEKSIERMKQFIHSGR